MGDYFVKEVDPEARPFMQWYGRGTLRAQARALRKLRDMAPEFTFDDVQLITRDVGRFEGSVFGREYWRTWWKATKRLGLRDFINDIQPRNMGAGGVIFDPIQHPLDRTLLWGFSAGVGSGAGIYVGKQITDDG